MSFRDLEAGRPLTSFARAQHKDPSRAVAAGVFQINTALSAFRRLATSLGTPKDSLDLRRNLHKTRRHIGQLVKETSCKLKQVFQIYQHTAVSPSKRISDTKLARDFQLVLREFQNAQRHVIEKEVAYAISGPKKDVSPRNTARELEISSLKIPENNPLLVESNRQEAPLLENKIVLNEAVTEDRNEGIQEIRQQIGEMNEVFKDMEVLIHGQGSLIDDFSSDIERSHVAPARATSHLARASSFQASNSSMACLLLLIFGIVWLIVVTIVLA